MEDYHTNPINWFYPQSGLSGSAASDRINLILCTGEFVTGAFAGRGLLRRVGTGQEFVTGLLWSVTQSLAPVLCTGTWCMFRNCYGDCQVTSPLIQTQMTINTTVSCGLTIQEFVTCCNNVTHFLHTMTCTRFPNVHSFRRESIKSCVWCESHSVHRVQSHHAGLRQRIPSCIRPPVRGRVDLWWDEAYPAHLPSGARHESANLLTPGTARSSHQESSAHIHRGAQ